MARRNKTAPGFDLSCFLRASPSDERFARVYEGMLKSENYRALSPGAKNLLIVCYCHTLSKINYSTLYRFCNAPGNETTYSNTDGYFILTREQLKAYGISQSKASGWFKQLCEFGFIKIVESNQHRKRANVYRLHNGWKRDK